MKVKRKKIKGIVLKAIRILGWVWLGLVSLLLLVSIAIQIPVVQNAIVQRIVTFAETTIGTPVSLDRVSIAFPKRIVLQGLFVEDQQADTLLYAGSLSVDADMVALLSRRIQLNEVKLENVVANVSRTAEGVFNFDYIVDSFSGEEAPQQPSGPGWDFAIYDVILEEIKMSFDDRLEGNEVSFALLSLHIDTNEFDLSANSIDVDEIALTGLHADVRKYMQAPQEQQSPTPDEETDNSGLVIQVRNLDLKDIATRYANSVDGSNISLDLGVLRATDHKIDMTLQVFEGGTIYLGETFLAYQQMAGADTTYIDEEVAESTETPESQQGWKLRLDQLTFENNSLQYYDFTTTRVQGGFDPAHLWVTALQLDIEGIAVGEDQYRARVKELSFHEAGGFRLRSMTSDIRIDSTQAVVDDFDLQTDNSHVRFNLVTDYPSLSTLGQHFKQVTVAATIDRSYIGMADVNLLSPSSLPLNFPDSGRVLIEAGVSGVMDDLAFESLSVSTLSSTALLASGNIRNISAPDDLWFNVSLEEFSTTSQDVMILVPDTLLPQSLTLPEWVRITGKFSGTPVKPDILVDLNSDIGAVHVDALLDFDSASDQGYAGNVKVMQFDLGKLIRQEGMGVLDLEGSLEGSGMTMDDIDVYAKVQVNEFEFNDYVYRDLSVDGSLDKSIFKGNAAMDDPNLKFDLKGDLDYGYAGVTKQYHFDLDLQHVDLQALNFLNRPLKVRLRLNVDLDDADPGNLNGGLAIHDATFNTGDQILRMDSLLVASINQEGKSSLNIDSDFIHGAFTGTFDLLSLPSVLERHFSTYYALDIDSAATIDNQQFEFNLEVRNTSFLTEVLIPDLERIDPGEIRGSFNSEEHHLDLSVTINELVHTSISATDINLDVASNRTELDYDFSASNITAGALTVPKVGFDGRVAGDSIETGILVYDSAGKERYLVRGIFKSLEDAYRFSLLPDNLVLNYNSWSIPADNAVLVTTNGFAAQNLDLSFEEQAIRIRAPVGPDSTLNVTLEQLNLKSLVNIAFADTLIRGSLGGEIDVYGSKTRGPLEASINISNLAVGDEAMGDITIAVDQPLPGQTILNLAANGPGLDMSVGGDYNAAPGEIPRIQLEADIRRLSLQAVQPFVRSQVTGLKGNVRSSLTVTGSPDQPDIDGTLTFENVEAIPGYTGSTLKLSEETIAFRGSTVTLNNFTIRDQVDNAFVLDGRITAGEQYSLDLTATAKDFQLLNTAEGDNDLFYGQVWLNTTAKVRGTLDHPEVEMSIGLGEKSDFTFVVPQSEAGVMGSEGIVVFVDRDKPIDSLTDISNIDSLSANVPFQGITLTSQVELNGQETFTIVLDPLTEDKLVVSGEASLTLDIDDTGNMNLTGRYELTKGSYGFTFYNLVKRDFVIEEGSTITWSGEPMNAALDITASYRIDASPIDLVASQTGEDENLEAYRARLPFLVYLNIKGDLLRPEITFSLDMPEQQRGAVGGSVYARIQDINTRESDVNKQVFALLILQRFVSDNPFETQSGGTLQAAARTSVNRMLSDQLNRMAQNIKGVELTFDLQSYSDYEEGNNSDRTQLQLGVSKRLLHDRLVVKLSGNVDIEGGQGQQNNFTDYIGDLAIEYKLTEDGRLRINGFYNSDYDMIDGELKETGVGLIYIKDYDSFKELFKSNDQSKK